MVKVEILGMALDEKGKSPIVVLKDEAETRILPIWIGALEAMAISMVVNKVDFPRPMTHDLLLSVIGRLDGTVNRVEITDIENGTFFAEIVIEARGKTLRIDSRPSDAVALAVRAECPILAAEGVLAEAGAPFPEHAETVISTDDPDKWQEELDKLSEDEIKYKM